MNIIFKSIILHNFLSFGHSEINLEDKKYCLVSGINKCSKDNAVSNGSGKSTIWSGICWALTGETIQGITSGIKNINIDKPFNLFSYIKINLYLMNLHFDHPSLNKSNSGIFS